MPRFVSVYTDKQREAMGVAVVDRGIPPKRIVELAAAGELTLDGENLEPFETNANSVRDRARIVRARRVGKLTSELASLPPRDSLEVLRRRLVNAADQELAVQEKRPRGKRDLERLRQIGRLLREAAALPGPDDPRPVQPGQKRPGTQTTEGGATVGGLAGDILKAAGRVETRDPQPADKATPLPTNHGEHAATGAATEQQSTEQTDGPGAWASEQVGALSRAE